MSRNPSRTDPVTQRIAQLVGTIQEAERELQSLVGDQVNAVVGATGGAPLLRDAFEWLGEREAAQRELAATQMAILDAIPAQIALLDPEGIVRTVNSKWREFAIANGLASDDFGLGTNYIGVCEAAHGDCAEESKAVARGVGGVLRGKLPSFALEYPCHAPHEKRWFRLMVTPLRADRQAGAVVMHIDVTERKLAEVALAESAAANLRTAEALRAERERLVTAQRVAVIGSWETDLATLEVQWSDETYRIFGMTPGEAQPSHQLFLQQVHPDDRAEVDAAFHASFGTRAMCTIEHRLLLPDRSIKHVEERWHVVTDATGAPMCAMGTCQDITERKQLEAQFLRAQRLESVGTLAGGIAHDLNNVLAPIMSAVELLSLDEKDPERLDSLTTIARSATRGTDLVKQVIAFARGVEGKRVPVRPGEVVQDVERLMKETFPKAIRVTLKLPTNLWNITGDPTQLHQVLLNLCVNARDALHDGGDLQVECINIILDEVQVKRDANATPGAYVCLSVSDNGVGIPLEIQDRLFEPFFTTKELGRGTGLGLSTVHSIVRSYGGFIRLTSQPGHGARFDLFLPANLSDATELAGDAPRQLPRGDGEMILVVDDEEAIRSVLQRTLERFGYRVMQAGDGAEALAIYAAHRGAIDLVLTDMTMPVMDGARTIVALRAMDAGVRIVASSGQDTDDSALWALGAGKIQFVPKPYTTEVLLTVLHRALHAPR